MRKLPVLSRLRDAVYRPRLLPAFLVCLAAGCAAGCATASKPAPLGDVVLTNQTTAARAAFEQGQYDSAVSLYSQALHRAWAIDDPAAIADASYNLAICLMEQGKLNQASSLLVDADDESRRAGLGDDDILLVQAKIALMTRQSDVAEQAAARVIADAKADGPLTIQARVIVGEAEVQSGDAAGAATNLALARAALTADPAAEQLAIAAGVDELAGQLARLNQKPIDAAAAFDRQADELRVANRYPEMAAALARAGESYDDAGQWARAADRFFRAARSYAGAADMPAATSPWLARAAAAAKKAGDEALSGRIDSLRRGDETSPDAADTSPDATDATGPTTAP
jgi:tetratricopeptide (TPR) repeat protein